MATGPVKMAPGRLECQQGLATWHQRCWDGNRAWSHSSRAVGMATDRGWMGWLQGLAKWYQGGWDGNRAWPHGSSEAGMAPGPGHIAPG